MEAPRAVSIGILSPATPDRPHFKSLGGILPPGVSIAHEGLGVLGESYQDLVGKTDQIIDLAKSFVQRHDVGGLMLTGGFVTLFNPGLEEKVAAAISIPVVSAVSSAVAALKTFGADTLLLMTPFDAAMSVFTTCALSTITWPPIVDTLIEPPCTVLASFSLTTSAAITLPGTTW